jgi:DNA mismatch endonuclease, patch repair protein
MAKSSVSWATSPAVRRSMLGNRGRDTRPELAVRRAAHVRGLRYRVSLRPVPGLRRTADLVFPRQKVAVLLDGCYWHGCPAHYRPAKQNATYWAPKIERNRARDAETTAAFEAAGWTVLRFWEHDDPEQVAASIEETVRARAWRATG